MDMRDRIKEKLQDKITNWLERSIKRIDLSIDKKDIFRVTQVLFKDLQLRFITASALDYPDSLEVIYHFSNDPAGEVYSVRVLLKDKNKPEVQSISPIFPGAEWIEREIWEMFGIKFSGHPNLKRLLLADDWPQEEYPLRKKNEP